MGVSHHICIFAPFRPKWPSLFFKGMKLIKLFLYIRTGVWTHFKLTFNGKIKGLFSLVSLILCKDFYLQVWTQSYINSLLYPREERGTLGQLRSLIPAAVIVFSVCVCVCCVRFLCTSLSLSPFSGLALAIRDQEYHGFLFANVSHDRGQLVDVATVEMLCLPQVQDHRGWARFGCKETHVSAEERKKREEHRN